MIRMFVHDSLDTVLKTAVITRLEGTFNRTQLRVTEEALSAELILLCGLTKLKEMYSAVHKHIVLLEPGDDGLDPMLLRANVYVARRTFFTNDAVDFVGALLSPSVPIAPASMVS